MLGKQGIIPKSDADLIVRTLGEILRDIEEGTVEFSAGAEDIHTNIESLLIERIGDVGKKLHTGRSRNDQVALDLRLYLRDECEKIYKHVKELINTLIDLAEKNIDVIMPGYTHLQKAQPVLFSHQSLAYCEMFIRDGERISNAFG